MPTVFGPYGFSNHANGLDSDELTKEIEAAIPQTVVNIASDVDAATYTVELNTAPDAGEETTLHGDSTPPTAGGVIGAHDRAHPDRAPMSIIPEAAFEPIEPHATSVVANDYPAIECQDAQSGYGAAQGIWPQDQHTLAKMRGCARFIVKEDESSPGVPATGTNVRLALKVKARATGDDTSTAFTATGVAVVPVNFTTIGDSFEGTFELDASAFKKSDSLAIHLGRDGDETLAGGAADDIDVAIQIISVELEAR